MLALTTVAFSLSLLGVSLAQIDHVGINLADEVGKYHQPKRSTPTATCLVADALQTASFRTGLENGTAGIRPGLTESPTNEANFINFCSGLDLTNGRQNPNGSCNGIPMGRIPAATNMVSTLITFPQPSDRLSPLTTFTVTLQTRHLRAGHLVNPSAAYYAAPQDLDEHGDILGHVHVTIQEIGESLRAGQAPDPAVFAFFKGVDDPGDGKGNLRAEVSGGLQRGVYRVCTMTAARNHQPVVMPVAQRGAQDDCVRFEVGS